MSFFADINENTCQTWLKQILADLPVGTRPVPANSKIRNNASI
jgi:hypothetical protein